MTSQAAHMDAMISQAAHMDAMISQADTWML